MKQQNTKNNIADVFFVLLNERYFDKITVRDIVEECGVTRNTFYYYFEDVYDIIDDSLNREIRKVILAGRGKRISLEHLLEPVVKFFTENKRVAVHLFKSSKKDEICSYIEKAIRSAIDHYVGDIPGSDRVSDFDRAIIVDFYSFAVMGLFNQWITTGMKGNPTERVLRAGVLFENSMKKAVEKGSL